MIGPLIRIALRYGVGYFAGSEVGSMLSDDPEIVMVLTAAAVALIEGAYAIAKRKGWAT